MSEEHRSEKPLYLQLASVIRSELCENLDPNDRLPSEREICRVYDVSRTTVRLAMKELEDQGYIYRVHGKGTFVSAINKNKQNLGDYYSFTEQTKRQGKVPKSLVLEFEIVNSNYFIAGQLGIDPGNKIIRFVRLRLADNIPMMVETTYLPHDRFSTLTEDMLNQKPMYDIFREDFDSRIETAEETFSAAIIGRKKANLLGVSEGDACLKLSRTSWDSSNRIIEFTASTARADQFNYKVYYNHR